MNERERKEIQILSAALECASPAERSRYLDETCGNDLALRQKLNALLEIQGKADQFFGTEITDRNRAILSRPGGADSSNILSQSGISEKPGQMIGRYKLLQKIGEGGCGVVYMADQEEPVRRRIALKIIKLGMDTKSVIARFEAERQALALMDHPNIAKVHDAGATETGRPYFVMELVRGVKITDYCDDKNLSTKERLDLFIQVCQAIQHAHQKGIIHRDIKPSNILVTVNDGVALPKVIDFGIAKATTDVRLTDKTVFTAFEQFIGTPAYMSPEQAEITSVDVDTRSDIYSLGVLLYELLTGKTPFDPKELLQAGLDEMRRTIREKEPDRPSTKVSTLGGEELTSTAKRRGLDAPKLANTLRGDLDWIVMKCLEKDRARRYETANGLASDIQRHLSNEPVVACPPSNLYKFHKLVRRNKLAFAAGTGVAAALMIGLAIALWQSIQKTRAYNRAVAAEKAAQAEATKSEQVAQFLKDMLAGVGPSKALGRDTKMLREILDNTAHRLEGLTNQPAVEADLRTILGDVYYELCECTNTVAMYQRSLELRRRLYGEEHLAVAASLDNLGLALNSCQGKLAEAEAFHREALAMRRKLLGQEHPEVAESLNNLALALSGQSKLDEAETTQREALAMQRKLFGNEHSAVATSLNNLALVLDKQGRQVEAEAFERESLAIRRKLLGNEHPDVALALANLASLLRDQGKLTEAEAIHREALAMRRKVLGQEHPIVCESLNSLGVTLSDQGRNDEAESLLREAVALYQKLFGNEHPPLATLTDLGSVLRQQGKLSEAEKVLRDALEFERKHMSNEIATIAATLSHLAGVLYDKGGKLPEAVALQREAVALRRKQPEGQLDLARELVGLARSLDESKQLSEACTHAQEGITLYRRNPGSNIDDQSYAFNTLGKVLADQGNLAEAEAVQTENLSILRKRAPDNMGIPAGLAELAVTLIAQKKFAEAELVMRQCLEFREKHSQHDWFAFSAQVLLGESLLGQKKYDEAERQLLAGCEGMQKHMDKIPGEASGIYRRQPRVKALQLLAQLYEETGRSAEAGQWKAKLTERN